MYCAKCGSCVEETGGTQMRACYHFLCLKCVIRVIKKTDTSRLRCVQTDGTLKCPGYLRKSELKLMVPDDVYHEYKIRYLESKQDRQRYEEMFDESNLTEDEMLIGINHKMSFISGLVKFNGFSYEEAEDYWNSMNYMENQAEIECQICMEKVDKGDGLVLKDCFHYFCKECLRNVIRASETASVTCPEPDCDEDLKYSEVAGICDEKEIIRHFEVLSLKEAEAAMRDAKHCLRPNCTGFVIIEEGINEFACPKCQANNCLACKVVHPGTCAQFKQQVADDKNRQLQQKNDRLSENAIKNNLNKRYYMNCPKCNAVIEKNGGCPNMICHNRGCGHRFVWSGLAL